MQKVELKWIDGFRFVVKDENKHSFVLDTKAEVGGTETGFQPIDMLLIGLGGCMAFDIVLILKKKGSIYEILLLSLKVNGQMSILSATLQLQSK